MISPAKGKAHQDSSQWPLFYAGNDLLSPTLSRAVPSAQPRLAAVVGMGTGGPPAVRSPTTWSRQPSAVSRQLNLVRWGCLHRSEEHTSELQSPCNLVCR